MAPAQHTRGWTEAKAAADTAKEATCGSSERTRQRRQHGQEWEPDEKLEGWGYYLEIRDEACDSDHDFQITYYIVILYLGK